MTDAVFAAMNIPEPCRLEKRVYKRLFEENGRLTPADKKAFREDVESVVWAFTLKPTTIAIPSYADDEREYDEVALLRVGLRNPDRVSRLAEIIHRTIPYPLILAFESEGECLISLAPKRFSQAEKGAIVAEEFHATGWLNRSAADEIETAFWESLDIQDWPQRHFHAFYAAAIDRVVALACARRSGQFRLGSAEEQEKRRDCLARCRALEARVAELRASIRKEEQFNRQVAMNSELKNLERELARESAGL